MEDLFKKRDAVFETDYINTCWVMESDEGQKTRMTFDDWYADVSGINLSESVPERIREQFDMARNTLLYSWFSYRLRMVSLLYSYTVVENALREKLQVGGKRSPGLGALLKKAVAEGLLHDSGFSVPRADREESFRYDGDQLVLEVTYNPPSPSDLRCSTTYVMQLCEVVPLLRNSLAHGKAPLFPDVLTPMIVHAEIINMLFEPHKSVPKSMGDRFCSPKPQEHP
jgi:hypothetical protein